MQMTQLQLTKMSAINLPVFNTLFFKKRQHTKPYILNATLFEQL